MTTLSQSDYETLGEVTRSRAKLIKATESFDERVRIMRDNEMRELNDALDISIRKAYDQTHNINAIKKAYGTSAYRTIKDALDRTEGITLSGPSDDDIYVDWVRNIVIVNDENFQIIWLDDGDLMLNSENDLYDENGDINTTIAALDGVFEGQLYDKVVAFLRENAE